MINSSLPISLYYIYTLLGQTSELMKKKRKKQKKCVYISSFFIVCVTCEHTLTDCKEYEASLMGARARTLLIEKGGWCVKRCKAKELAALCQLFIILFVLILNGWIYMCVLKLFYSLLNSPTAIWKVGQMLVFIPDSSLISKRNNKIRYGSAHSLTKMIIIFLTPLPILCYTQFKHHHLRSKAHNLHPHFHFYCVAQVYVSRTIY